MEWLISLGVALGAIVVFVLLVAAATKLNNGKCDSDTIWGVIGFLIIVWAITMIAHDVIYGG
jgi:predicted permease